MNIAISTLRIFAIILIVNEHLDKIYPKYSFALGGHLGNSIFFFVSGWGLAQSYITSMPNAFLWYRKRFLKLLLMLSAIIFLIDFPSLDKILFSILFHIIPYPLSKSVSFIPNLVIIYALSYILLSLENIYLKTILFILSIMPIGVYLLEPNKSIIYNFTYPISALFCFISGILVNKEHFLVNKKFLKNLGIVIFLMIFTITFHAILRKIPFNEISNIYITYVEVFILFLFLTKILEIINLSKHQNIIHKFASTSLAVYLVHFSVINYFTSAGLIGYVYVVKTYLISFALAIPLTTVALKIVELINVVVPNSIGYAFKD